MGYSSVQEPNSCALSSHITNWDRNSSFLENGFPKVKKYMKFLANIGGVSQTPCTCCNDLCSSLSENC